MNLNNKINKIMPKEIDDILYRRKSNNDVFVATIDGRHIKSSYHFFVQMELKLSLPRSYGDIDEFLNSIRSPEFLKNAEYIIVVYHYKEMCENNDKDKDEIIRLLHDDILPWWEVRAKPFNVYFVDCVYGETVATLINNKICEVTPEEVDDIIKHKEQDTNVGIVTLDGKQIRTVGDFIAQMEQKFSLPDCDGNMNCFFDWIRDITFLNKDEYIVIIYNHEEICRCDRTKGDEIIRLFRKTILPWWEGDVENCVMEGKAKPFNVYLVSLTS